MGAREWALLLALSVLWGGSFFFAKVALAEVAAVHRVVLGRVGLAALALLIVVRAAGKRLPTLPGPVARLPRHGRAQQPDPVQPDLLGPDADRQRSRLDPERDHAALDRPVCASVVDPDERLTAARLAGVAAGWPASP